ncbi:hypothetical protein [Halioxenophilus aromaticivorans]|uniref:Uncharacterized protein n=1 Tax=Halioxenophilus aromaticivorans TaxID=1306992 RepID=A0AAV3U0Y6_9ALTE
MAESMESINKGKSIEISGFDCAEKSVHMIEWLGLGKDYRKFVVSDVEGELYKQQPGSQLLKLQCTGEPELLTGALPQNGDESKAILTLFSATFPLEATVNLGGEVWVLTIDQNYYAENLNIPNERKLTQNFNVKGSAKQ